MPPKSVDVREAQAHLDELLSLVAAGTEILLMDGATPLARLVPLRASAAQRIPGLHAYAGAAWMSDDFDKPLPDEFWAGTE